MENMYIVYDVITTLNKVYKIYIYILNMQGVVYSCFRVSHGQATLCSLRKFANTGYIYVFILGKFCQVSL